MVTNIAEAKQITILDQPIIRNLLITQYYFELSRGLSNRLYTGANWCTFATWASKQAGRTIRKEDVGQMIESTLEGGLNADQLNPVLAATVQYLGHRWEHKTILSFAWELLDPAKALENSSQKVATGNLKVFTEIGIEFARFIEACTKDISYIEEHIQLFCDSLQPGDPPEGQRYLRQAFRRYYCAFFESDHKTRAELLLLANLEIGFHEQTRLQPEIQAALEGAIPSRIEITWRLVKYIFTRQEKGILLKVIILRLLGKLTPFDELLDILLTFARLEIRRILTKHMMSLELSGGRHLRLAMDLNGRYPSSLVKLSNPDLLELLTKTDPNIDSPIESGAVDWANLSDRMHYITELFRTYQEDSSLFDEPFSLDQVAEIKAGRVPKGKL